MSSGAVRVIVRRQSARSQSENRFVTWRALIVGIAILPLNTYWLTWNVWYQQHLTGDTSLFSTAVFVLATLLALNWLVGRVWPRHALWSGELLVVYIMVTIGTTMCASGWDWMTNLPAFLTYPFRFASKENRWAETMLPFLPHWVMVSDREAVAAFWEGHVSPYSPLVLGAWWRPAIWWTSFVGALVWVFLCMNSLLRKRWAEEEKMAFPMVTVPTAMVEPGGRLWRTRAFQIGAGASVAIALVNFAHSLVPSVPGIPFSIDYGQYISHLRPWSGIRQPFFWYGPFLIGICYLIPLDLLFSLWIFTLIGKAQQVLAVQFGWNTQTWGGPPYVDWQSVGAMAALMMMVLWLDRRYLTALLRAALTHRGPLADRHEALSHRTALLGFVAGIAYLWWFLHRMGVSAYAAAPFLALYLLISLTLARFRAQLGPPHHELRDVGASDVLLTVAGSRSLNGRTLAAFTVLNPFTSSQRGNPSPITMEALKMGEGHGRLRGLGIPIVVAAVVGALSLFCANMHLHHQGGADLRSHMAPVLNPGWRFGDLEAALSQPSGGAWGPVIAMGAGAAACAALMALKLQIPSFPLHPVALPVSTGGIEGTVAAVFIAWVVKAAVLRWGGRGTYRVSLHAALGVIVGDAVAGCSVAILRQLLDIPVRVASGG